MPVRDMVAQDKARKAQDKAHQKVQKEREAAAKKHLAELAKKGAVVATQSFSYPSKEQGGMRSITRGEDVFHPDDEPVRYAPMNFKEALHLKGTV